MSHVEDRSRKILKFLCGTILSRHVLFSPKLGDINMLFTYNFSTLLLVQEINYKAELERFSLSDALQHILSISDNIRGSVQAINLKLLNPATDTLENE
jgi:hypothetical protein